MSPAQHLPSLGWTSQVCWNKYPTHVLVYTHSVVSSALWLEPLHNFTVNTGHHNSGICSVQWPPYIVVWSNRNPSWLLQILVQKANIKMTRVEMVGGTGWHCGCRGQVRGGGITATFDTMWNVVPVSHVLVHNNPTSTQHMYQWWLVFLVFICSGSVLILQWFV